MALMTPCTTPGAHFDTHITPTTIELLVGLPFVLSLTGEEAATLEYTIHNAMELALAPLFVQDKHKDQIVTT